jgi:hypothetical protein
LTSPRFLFDYFGSLPTRIPPAHFVDKHRAFTIAERHSWRALSDRRLAVTCLIRNFWLTRLLLKGDIHLMVHKRRGPRAVRRHARPLGPFRSEAAGGRRR